MSMDIGCSKTELDLFTVPPVQRAILEDYVIESRHTSGSADDTSLEFNFAACTDDYTDLSQCSLTVRLKVVKLDTDVAPVHYDAPDDDGAEADGPDIDAVPVNLIFHSIWKQMDLFLNDELVESSLDYPFKSYLSTLFSYSSDSKNTWLPALEGWREDEPGKFDVLKQNGAIDSAKHLVKNGRVFELRGKPNFELFHQSRLIPNNVKIRVVLSKQRPAFYMMGNMGVGAQRLVNTKYKIITEKAVLSLRRCKLNPEEQLKIEKQIAHNGATFPTQAVIIKTVAVPQGLMETSVDSLFSNNEIPPRILIAQVDNDAYVGSYAKSPFNFKHNNLVQASVTYSGQTYSHSTDFVNKNKMGPYLELYKMMSHYPCDHSNGITKEQWEGGTTLIPFDLCPDQSYSGNFISRRKVGNISLSLRWSVPLPTNINLLIIALYDNSYYMGVNRDFQKALVY